MHTVVCSLSLRKTIGVWISGYVILILQQTDWFVIFFVVFLNVIIVTPVVFLALRLDQFKGFINNRNATPDIVS